MKFINKLYLPAILIYFCSMSAHAEAYYGINLGGNVVIISKKINYLDTESNLTNKIADWRAQVFLGYNLYCVTEFFSFVEEGYFPNNIDYNRDPLYLALEADFNYNSGKASSDITPWFLRTKASQTEKLEFGYDLFLLGKYRFTPHMILFLGPGFSQTKIEIDSNYTAGNLGTTKHKFTWRKGWSLKGGVEVPISDRANFLLSLQYTCLKNITLTAIEPLTEEIVSTEYKPSIYSLMVGVSFW